MSRPSALTCLDKVPRPSACIDTVLRPSACLDTVPWPSACLDMVPRPSACQGTTPRPSAMLSHGASAYCHDMHRHDASTLCMPNHGASAMPRNGASV